MSLLVTMDGTVAEDPKRYENRAGDVAATFAVLSHEERVNAETGKPLAFVRTIRILAEDSLAEYVLGRVSAGASVRVTSNRITTDGPGSADTEVAIVARQVSLTD